MTREQALARMVQNFREWYANHFEDFPTEINDQLLCLDNEAETALANPHNGVNADMLAALRMAHHALEGRERKDVALDAVAAAIAKATS